MDPVTHAAVAPDHVEVALLGEMLLLRRRQPSNSSDRPTGVASAPCRMKSALAAFIRERSPRNDRKPNMTVPIIPRPIWGRRRFPSQLGRTIESARPDLDRSGCG
jgi:hypothetical protein